MKRIIDIIIALVWITALFGFSYVYAIGLWTGMHEGAHAEINRKFDLNSTIEIEYVGFPSIYIGKTSISEQELRQKFVTKDGNFDEQRYYQLIGLHSENEISGYNDKHIMTSIFIVGYLICLFFYIFIFAYFDARQGENMDTQIIILGTDAFAQAAKNMYQRGEIDAEQYAEIVRRASAVPQDLRDNIVIEKKIDKFDDEVEINF